MQVKLAAIIVTYHPDISHVERNIASFCKDVECLMLWDNSECPVDFNPLKAHYPNLTLLHEGSNQGLPVAYNCAIKMATEKGCTHLMTMDQDSTFEGFDEYRRGMEKVGSQRSEVGIICCPVNHDIQESGYRETTVCQSGSIFSLEMLNRIGDFREDLFIGMVDAEMSLRAIEKGYKIYQLTGCNLIQHVGSGREVSLLRKKIQLSDYTPLRHYYDSRNRILLWYEFPYDYSFKQKIHHFWSRVKLMMKIALFEKKKTAKIGAILSGSWYGLLNRPKPYKKTH